MNFHNVKILFAVIVVAAILKINAGRIHTGILLFKRITGIEKKVAAASDAQPEILIDQLGYKVYGQKIALFKNYDPGKFEVINFNTNKTVFTGSADQPEISDKATGDNVYTLNFSTLTKPGNYYVMIPSLSLKSSNFLIDNNVYYDCAVKALQSFYYERCGIQISNGTIWKHPACHTKPAYFYDNPEKQKDVTGGWHDAGDYNKFVPTTAVSAAFLLYTYENNPSFFKDGQLNIPENHNSIPDILDEARWGLEWLLKMQSPDGAVYHKVSIKKWTGEHLPDKEPDKQYIFGISSASTADEAAVTALGAKIFFKYDKEFAAELLKSAISAWYFLSKNPGNIPLGGFKNPPDVLGGEYNDDDDSDERLWASIELYRATGTDEYLNYFLSHYQKVGGPNYTVSWKNTANFAYYSFLKLPVSIATKNARERIISNLNTYAGYIVTKIEKSGYRCSLNSDEYFWGSNSILLGYAFDLLNAYFITGKEVYFQGAVDQLHYILGRNTFGISFVTGLGTNPVRYPYHQFSMLSDDGNPVPGMVVAGPNKFSKLNGVAISNYPGKCYEDNQKNYFVNEPAINYTAPLVFVASYFSEAASNSEVKNSMKSINQY